MWMFLAFALLSYTIFKFLILKEKVIFAKKKKKRKASEDTDTCCARSKKGFNF